MAGVGGCCSVGVVGGSWGGGENGEGVLYGREEVVGRYMLVSYEMVVGEGVEGVRVGMVGLGL